MEKIAVVDMNDKIIGYEEKMYVHELGIPHRAFSILLFNKNNEVLLQRRALNKYHSPGEWTNTCCSHQRKNETLLQAANRRLKEELGIEGVALEEVFVFHYKCKFSNDLYENEIDHVYIGRYDGEVDKLNPKEVCDVKWISYENLALWMIKSPEEFTFWFKNMMTKIPENFEFE